LILLINSFPPTNSPFYIGEKLLPLGLTYLASTIETEGFPVRVLDNYLLEKPTDFLKQIFKQLNPKIVGITCTSIIYQTCIETAWAVKEVLPSCKMVVDGPHPTVLPHNQLMMKYPSFYPAFWVFYRFIQALSKMRKKLGYFQFLGLLTGIYKCFKRS
jgi:hypothetical protein